jgi:hypothetical protein
MAIISRLKGEILGKRKRLKPIRIAKGLRKDARKVEFGHRKEKEDLKKRSSGIDR